MPFTIGLRCAKADFTTYDCDPAELFTQVGNHEEAATRIPTLLAEHGWVEHKGQHYCKRHNPADAGETAFVGAGWQQLGETGVEVRLPRVASDSFKAALEYRVAVPDGERLVHDDPELAAAIRGGIGEGADA